MLAGPRLGKAADAVYQVGRPDEPESVTVLMTDDAKVQIFERVLRALGTRDVPLSQAAAFRDAARGTDDVGGIVGMALRHERVARRIVQLLYRWCLSRDPDEPSWPVVAEQITNGHPIIEIARALISSEEYYAQRCHQNDSIFVSMIPRILLCEEACLDLAALEGRLATGATRDDLLREALASPAVRDAFGAKLCSAFRLPRPWDVSGLHATPHVVEQMMVLVAQGEAFAAMDGTTDLAGWHAHRLARSVLPRWVGERAARAALDLGLEASLADALRTARSLGDALLAPLTTGTAIAHHLDHVLVGGAIDGSPALRRLVDGLRSVGPPSSLSALGGRKLGVRTAEAAAAPPHLLHADDHDLEQLARPLVRCWIDFYVTAPPGPEACERLLAFWALRLARNDYYFAVLAEFLAQDLACGIDIRLLSNAPLLFNMPPGSLVHRQALGADSVDLPRPIVVTSFFYWYDIHFGRDFLRSPDSWDVTSDRLALTLNPPSFDHFSYLDDRWFAAQLDDIRAARVDAILPVYFGTPFSDEATNPNTADHARNRRNAFAEPGLRLLRRVLLARADAAATRTRIAMFYDSSSINFNNPKTIQIHYAFSAGVLWCYETIRNFFSHLPRELWLCIDGRPLVFVYHPSFGLGVHPGFYPRIRTEFLRDFGVDPYIVTASEEEAPRILVNDRVVKLAERMRSETPLDLLVDLMLADELYATCGRSDVNFVDILARDCAGASCRPRTKQDALEHLLGGDRAAGIRLLLLAEESVSHLARSYLKRYLRCDLAQASAEQVDLYHRVRSRLADDHDVFGALLVVLCSAPFLAAAGGTAETLCDWIYQSLVWKHPNPECPDGSTTATGIEGRTAFLRTLEADGREAAIREFLQRDEVLQAIACDWFFTYYHWWNPGPAEARFYWSGAIAPTIREVATIGPGYDQSALGTRHAIVQPRRNGERYREMWTWLTRMDPVPPIIHIETWNEFFEGTNVGRTAEFGDQYIAITAEFVEGLRNRAALAATPVPASA